MFTLRIDFDVDGTDDRIKGLMRIFDTFYAFINYFQLLSMI